MVLEATQLWILWVQVCYNLSTSTNANPYESGPFKALGELLAKPPGDAKHLRGSLTVWQSAEQPKKIMSLADGELSSARFEADGLRSIFREVSGEFGTFLSMLSLNECPKKDVSVILHFFSPVKRWSSNFQNYF